jgi:ABC-type oligopeptide transport system substrate-binding subunit
VLLSLAIACVLVIAVSGAQGSIDSRAGGIFRVTYLTSPGTFDHVDPALAYSRESWAILDTVCARLMRYRDAPPPRGYELVPDVAAAPPTVSADRMTWTFRLRSGFRFSNGEPVRADAFAQAIHRTLAPEVDSPGYAYTRTIVGAEDVHAGKATRASGVTARGNTLVVRFTRPVAEFDAWTTMPFFCAVPPALQPSTEGIRAFPGAGPYYVKEYRLNRKVEIRRNRFYGGTREHHVEGFDVDLRGGSADEMVTRVDTGRADWTYMVSGIALGPRHGLIRKYSINFSRFWLTPGLTVRMFVLNSSRPLFRNNPKLRQALNFVINRTGMIRPSQAVGAATDQYLPPGVAGYRQRQIYPLNGNAVRARELAAGNLLDGKAIFLVPDVAPALAAAQAVKEQLAGIGLDVDIRPLGEHATASSYLGRLGSDEPWDLALVLWSPDYVDPSAYINRLLDNEFTGAATWTRFDEPSFNTLMRQAARQRGAARAKAYAELDLLLARDVAPLVPHFVFNEATLISARVDRRCMLLRPGLVLTTICLKPTPA